MNQNYLESSIKQFQYYYDLGTKAINQLEEGKLIYNVSIESNSIGTIVKHMSGNMLSRWTNFLTEDGEKDWRKRDAEFENNLNSKEDIIGSWEKGWGCLLATLNSLEPEDLDKIIYIRNQGHTVLEAINRQLCHYSYHVGQIVFAAKQIQNENWQALSIAKGKSSEYNSNKFSQEKSRKHFLDGDLT